MGFTEPVAQQLLVGEQGVYTDITVTAARGESQTALRGAALGAGYQVKTGQELAKDQTNQISKVLAFFNYFLLGFAGISLFVGIFLILNTFSMRMVTVEAVVISVFGALLGLVVGSGLGAGVVRALTDQGLSDLGFPWAQMGRYLLGAAVIGVVAAILPAIRAARLNVLASIAYE